MTNSSPPNRDWLDLLRWPIALIQGVALRLTVPELQPPSDAYPDRVGDGEDPQPLRLFCLGESTIVGCGAERMSETLPVQLASRLAQRRQGAVHWQMRGRYGARAADCLRWLEDEGAPALQHDLALLVLGVNDSLRLTTVEKWRAEISALIGHLARQGQARVLLAGVPPMHLFPALRGPIRTLLGRRAQRLDEALAALAEGEQVLHVPMPDLMQMHADPDQLFARDRFHPSPLGYGYWAEHLVERWAGQGADQLVEHGHARC